MNDCLEESFDLLVAALYSCNYVRPGNSFLNPVFIF